LTELVAIGTLTSDNFSALTPRG